MKIGPLESKPAAAPIAERKSQPAKVQFSAESSAQVALSPAASALAGADSDPAFDTAKVARVAQAIRDGKFTVNAEAIADKLIVNAEELLGRRLS
ncbi:MAG: flagellar biosynthesis anti-sigma factor FlgM [Rubrivivax sp.]|nr:flagellar biosynthesis anti-sigma factor FlgM [Rubrivivax sp.]